MSPELTDFLKDLATDPDKLKAYLDDPDSALDGAGIPDSEKQMIKNKEFTKLGLPPSFSVYMVEEWCSQPTDSPPDAS